MNKTELIEHIAAKSDISKAAATRALASIIEAVKKTLKKGDTVTLVGFGTFSVSIEKFKLIQVTVRKVIKRLK